MKIIVIYIVTFTLFLSGPFALGQRGSPDWQLAEQELLKHFRALLQFDNINNKEDVLIFIESKKSDILKRLKKRNNFNQKLFNTFNAIQLPIDYKKKKSQFIVKNNFTKKSIKKAIRVILREII